MSVADRIEELRKRYEENPRRFFAPLANEYRKSGDLEQAISLCQEHLADQPGNMNGHVVYGQALFEAGRFDEAAVTFETALSLDPENLIALRHLGDMARDHGNTVKAREWYMRVLDADPRNDEILGFIHQMEAAPATSEAPAAAPAEPIAGTASPDFGPPRAAATPTPVVPYVSVEDEPAPPPRQSTGLMDLSIDLGLNTDGIFDHVSEAVAEVSGPAPEDATPAAVDDGFASIGFPDEPAAPGPEAEVAPEFGVEAAPAPVAEAESLPRADAAPVGEVESLPDAAPAPEPEVALWPSDEAASEPTPLADLPSIEPAPPEPTAEVSPEARESSATDFLFADTITDFPTVGGGGGAADMDISATFDVDAVIGRTPVAGIEKVEPIAETPQPFVTETMAELYLQQGFRDEALEVYRRLSAQNPSDDSLRDRIASIEGGGRSSLSFEVVHEETLDVAEGSVPLGAMLEMTPREVVEDAHLHPHALEPVRTARAFFAALAVRRAVKSEAAAPADGGALVAAPSPAEGLGPGSLDAMFDGAIGEADEAMARTIASLAEGVERAVPSIKGKPTQAAETELSLDTVFRDSTPRTSGAVPRQSQTLRFDQFFASASDTTESSGAGGGAAPGVGDTGDAAGTAASGPGEAGGVNRPVAPAAGEPGSPADLEQFQSWLSRLKMP